MCRYDGESPMMFGGNKLFVEWLPDGELLIGDDDSWDPDLSYALAWWQREWCWYSDASAEWEMALINSDIDDQAFRRTVERWRDTVDRARTWFYGLLEARTGWWPSDLER